tara:strand:- start:104 stop:775 length:672 start_codon:yes stop_codon:yes gene_type:complete
MKVKILVPENLAEITLEQYQKFLKISKDNEDSLFLQQKMIEIFCNISLKEVLNIKHSSIIKIISHLNKLFEQKPKFKTTFKRGDLKFGFIPQLDDITFGEYVDLDSTLTDWETMDKAMGVLYRPITLEQSHKYIIEKYKTYDKYEMKQMPLDVVLGSLVFFWNLSKELMNHIPSFLKAEMNNLTSQQKQTFQKDGIGTAQFIDLVTQTLPKLMKLPSSPYTSA